MLPAELGHPGTAAFRRTWVHVKIEQPHLPLAVEHVVDVHLLVVDGYVAVLLEVQAVKTIVEIENPLAYCIQREVGSQLFAVEVVALLLELFRQIADIPRHDIAIRAIGTNKYF